MMISKILFIMNLDLLATIYINNGRNTEAGIQDESYAQIALEDSRDCCLPLVCIR